jgi:hypothetical protein
MSELVEVRRHGRRLRSFAREIGGGLYENVVSGRVVSVGLEPVGEWIVHRDGHVELFDRSRRHVAVLAWAAPVAGAAVTGGAVALTLLRRHRRAA